MTATRAEWPAEVVEAAVAAIRARLAGRVDVAIVAGSGLTDLARRVSDARVIAFGDLPGWPASTVPGHAGRLVLGHLEGRPVAVALGRAHLYEGYSARRVTFGVRVFARLGAQVLIATNAAGSLREDLGPGDLLVLADHLFLPGMAGAHPLAGGDDADGPRFPSMVDAYDPVLRRSALRAAAEYGLTAREGVYAMVAGPSFETPAEARMLSMLGADAVGMSTVPEVVVARQAGLRVLGLSVITNRVRTAPEAPADGEAADVHGAVLTSAAAAAPRLADVIADVVALLPHRV